MRIFQNKLFNHIDIESHSKKCGFYVKEMVPLVAGAHCNDGITEFFIFKGFHDLFRRDVEGGGGNCKGIYDARYYATTGGVIFK